MKLTPARRRLLECLVDGAKNAREIGDILYPHLHGYPHNGGPLKSASAASWQLGKLRAATMPDPWVNYGMHGTYVITAAGRKALEAA